VRRRRVADEARVAHGEDPVHVLDLPALNVQRRAVERERQRERDLARGIRQRLREHLCITLVAHRLSALARTSSAPTGFRPVRP